MQLAPMQMSIEITPDRTIIGFAILLGISLSLNLATVNHAWHDARTERTTTTRHKMLMVKSTDTKDLLSCSKPNFFMRNTRARIDISVLIHAKSVLSVARKTLGSSR